MQHHDGTPEAGGKRALIFGVANAQSLAWAIATRLREKGFRIALAYGDERLERRVARLAESLSVEIVRKCDVRRPEEIAALFEEVRARWGGLDTLVHSLAYADAREFENRFADTSREGFLEALEVSAYSLVELSRAAEPLFPAEGGSVLTLSYYGARKVMPGYNVMGVAKAALEACVRYLAVDLGARRVRVNAISAGPMKTLASSAVPRFQDKLDRAAAAAPLRELAEADDVGRLAAFLASDQAAHITGTTLYLDSGLHILGA